MFSRIFTIGTALIAAVFAAPLMQRDGCTPGLYNCFDGKSYAQCMVGGTWSITLPVAAGTTCSIGISANPWLPDSGTEPSSSHVPTIASTSANIAPVTTAPPPKPASTSIFSIITPTTPSSTAAPNPVTTSASLDSSGTVPPAPTGSLTGNGQFPSISTWPSWESMKAKYAPLMGQSCTAWGANNSPAETSEVLDAISNLSGPIDPRFVLSVVIQESSGCVRVPTTNNGVRNPGLMQDSNGSHSCNDGGSVQNPCPVSEIQGMITDGISGGANNWISALAFAQAKGAADSFAYAVAARMYNSGSVDWADLNNGLGATGSYVQSVMDRAAGLKV